MSDGVNSSRQMPLRKEQYLNCRNVLLPISVKGMLRVRQACAVFMSAFGGTQKVAAYFSAPRTLWTASMRFMSLCEIQ
jgi:hypothetical protein